MNVGEHLFKWQNVNLSHFYLYLAVSAIIAYFLVRKSNLDNKPELFLISFYLLTGDLNEVLTIQIPGFSFFEIQPKRLLLLVFSFFLFRKIFLSKTKINLTNNGIMPWWEIFLYAYFIFFVLSQIANFSVIGFSEMIVNLSHELNFLVIMLSVRLMSDKDSYYIIGKSILIGAVFSSIISIIQFLVDPYFLRIGFDRQAFGEILRTNGLFQQEHYNSYFLITAIIWAIIVVKNKNYRIVLIGLFTIGVVLSFHRMSWLIFCSIFFIYFVFIDKMAVEKIVLAGLTGIVVLLTVFIFYYQDIMNTSLVQERLNDPVEGRKGYYTMVLENIHKKPLFGYGGRNNEVYYTYMLNLTKRVGRATGEEGGIHSGYFSAMFYSGLPVFFCFTLFAIFSVLYYAKLSTEDIFYSIPFFIAFIFLIGNLTNTLNFAKHIGILYALHLGLASGIKQNKDLLTSDSRILKWSQREKRSNKYENNKMGYNIPK